MIENIFQQCKLLLFVALFLLLHSPFQTLARTNIHGVQPLSKIDILSTTLKHVEGASIEVTKDTCPEDWVKSWSSSSSPIKENKDNRARLLIDGSLGIRTPDSTKEIRGIVCVKVTIKNPEASNDDWVAVFSPPEFDSDGYCKDEGNKKVEKPYVCTAPIKYQFANYSESHNKDDSKFGYTQTNTNTFKLMLINQRAHFSFALFKGGLDDKTKPQLLWKSGAKQYFKNLKEPLFPRLALGETWDVMTVTWTSGYSQNEATPLVEWGPADDPSNRRQTPAGTYTYTRDQMCAAPARTVGWRDPGFIHTSFLKDLWPNTRYTYRVGHRISKDKTKTYDWSDEYEFKSPPFPGESSSQRIVIFGDMGKGEQDGSNEYANYQPGALNTTNRLIGDINNNGVDAIFLIGDMAYANGYLSQWDQYTAQIEPIASKVPLMVASGNHERDTPNSGSFYAYNDAGGECGVPAETTFYVPAKNRAKFWYSANYGLFHFCIADTEHDWREGTEQYKFLEECLASANRHKQPWLIFAGHRPLGYSSNKYFGEGEGSFEEPMGREYLQRLWQKYKVDIAFWGHVHNYERTCPVYENQCMTQEKHHYSGDFNGTIHVVAGGGGAHLNDFSQVRANWSMVQTRDFGYVKLTAQSNSILQYEFILSSTGKIIDSFTISRDYRDLLACVHDGCEPTTLAH